MKILVLADIHGNATALQSILAAENDFDSVVFLGDAVSPGPQPNETIALLAELSGVFIKGNHEDSMLDANSTSLWPDGLRAYMDWNRRVFDAAGFELLRTFQEAGTFKVDGGLWVLSHGDQNDVVRHVLPDTEPRYFRKINCANDHAPVMFGHSHVQFRKFIGAQEFTNPGSVGQNRCGRVAACYGLLQDGVFSHRHVRYDPQPFLDALEAVSGLDQYGGLRTWLKQRFLDGYANGAVEPWTGLAEAGYR